MNNDFVELNEWFKEQEKKEKLLKEKYPVDVPNDVCHYAFIYGFSIENSFKPKVCEYHHFFSTNFEDIYIWTYEKNQNSALLSNTNIAVKETPFWKTASRLIQLSLFFVEAFVSIEDPIDYKWMYYFDFDKSTIDNIVFYGLSEIESRFMSNGRVLKLTQIAELAPVIELLERDDVAYNAISLIVSAFSSHQICLICELSKAPWHDHLSEEPKIWNQANMLQSLEMAIVQSCRAVESILGEPPNKKKELKVIRHKQKWLDKIGINPDDIFEKANKSYLEFYYELFFELRNPSAHSYGNIHYNLERKRAVEAQCFAAIILREYINKNLLDNEPAISKLKFNKDLLSRVSEKMSTCITVD